MNVGCNECAALPDSFISGLDNEARDELRSFGVTVHYKKGQDIFRQGNTSEGCFCIKKGIVKTTVCSSDGKPLTVDIFSGKGVIGVSGILQPGNSVSATCLTDSELCFFPKRVLTAAMNKHTCILQSIMTIQHERYQQVCDLAVTLATKSVTERVAEALLKLQQTFGTDENNMIRFSITRAEIALLTGTSIESVFRVLANFKKKQFIEVEPSGIKILNQMRLQRIAKMNIE